MLNIVVMRSDAHLREVLRAYERQYQGNFARDALKKSNNLVGEVIAHILNGVSKSWPLMYKISPQRHDTNPDSPQSTALRETLCSCTMHWSISSSPPSTPAPPRVVYHPEKHRRASTNASKESNYSSPALYAYIGTACISPGCRPSTTKSTGVWWKKTLKRLQRATFGSFAWPFVRQGGRWSAVDKFNISIWRSWNGFFSPGYVQCCVPCTSRQLVDACSVYPPNQTASSSHVSPGSIPTHQSSVAAVKQGHGSSSCPS